MIHNAWTWAMGNANDLTATATLLTKIDGTLAAQYAKKSGMAVDDVRAMDAETWYTADEAVAAGLVDRIAAGKKAEASWNMSAYAKAPKIENRQPEQVDPAATEEHRARQQQRISMLARLQVS
jgi:ATP-dependent Clp protease protease subunit